MTNENLNVDSPYTYSPLVTISGGSQNKIFEKMALIMRDSIAIGKTKKNVQQNYNFRGIDDVYNGLNAAMSKHGVFTTSQILKDFSEERAAKSGGLLIYRILHIRYTFWAVDGSCVSTEVIGEGMDSGDKASNKSMAVAHKYALLQAFCIPTEEKKDPENDSHELVPIVSQAQEHIQEPVKMPSRSSVNAKLLEMKFLKDVDDAREKFKAKYGAGVMLQSSNKQGDKNETWGDVFQTHIDRVSGIPPVQANKSPQDEWSALAKSCKDFETVQALEKMINLNRSLNTEANWATLEDINKELGL